MFHCPHCDFGEEGQPPNGLPSPNVQQCKSCGLAIALDLYVIRPFGENGSASFSSLLPIHQKDGNWFTRYFSTVWLVLTKPQTVMSRVPVQEPLWNAWKFFLTTLLIMMATGLVPAGVFLALMTTSQVGRSTAFFQIILVFLFQIGFIFFFVCMYAILWSLVIHLVLQITGGSSFTLRRTTQAILYGGGASIAGIVPCIGGIASFVWWIVATTNMIVRGQRVSGSRASVATLAGPMFVVTCICGGYLVLIFSVLQPAITQARSTAQQIQQKQLQQNMQIDSEELTTDQQSK